MAETTSSTQVDFYLLSQAGGEAAFLLACRLADKAYQQGHQVYIITQEPAQAQKLDDMLWSFREDSFIPHALSNHDSFQNQPSNADLSPPIFISHQIPPALHQDILINLSNQAAKYFQQFKRIIQIVSANPADKERARQHFRYYREQGCTLQTHQL
jgi:DNA polymerase-3 subunit chi